MTKRFYLSFIFLFTLLLFGCSTDTVSQNLHVDEEINEETNEETKEDEQTEVKAETETLETDENINKSNGSLEDLTVHYIDADQGDACLFQFGDYTVMFDTGDWKNKRVINYIKDIGLTHIDVIIISHPHADHIGQLDQIINSISVDEVWMTENIANSNVFQNALNAMIEHDVDLFEPEAGDIFDIGEMEVEILHPKALTGDLNSDSIAARFTYGDISFMFTGDAYKKQEQEMIARADSLQADFLQLGHHGSDTSSDPSFIKAVNPSYAIYSAGANNSYGHPHNEVVNLMEKEKITLFGTDTHGTIIVTTDGKSYNISTEKDGKEEANKALPKSQEQQPTSEPVDTEQTDCIDINSASATELTKIIHIGESRAQDIINNRPYTSLDNLIRIKGIADKRLNDIKNEGLACVK